MAIFLDLDETLIHSIALGRLGWRKNEYPEAVGTTHLPNESIPIFKKNLNQHTNIARKRLTERIQMYRWTVLSGFIMVWRPYVTWFLHNISRLNGIDLYVWTAASKPYAEDVVKVLNLQHYGMKKLFTEQHVIAAKGKNLNILRNWGIYLSPNRMVIIDDRIEVKQMQPSRCIQIRPFKASQVDHREEFAELQSVFYKIQQKLNI